MNIEIKLEDITNYAKGINVYIDGKVNAYPVGCEKFRGICLAWNDMLAGAHTMPAFGVSLDGDTRAALKEGVWAEFVFGCPYQCGGMSFEKLLVAVKGEWSGFNIVRYTAEKGYEGRCFYYSLQGNMKAFYDVLTAV